MGWRFWGRVCRPRSDLGHKHPEINLYPLLLCHLPCHTCTDRARVCAWSSQLGEVSRRQGFTRLRAFSDCGSRLNQETKSEKNKSASLSEGGEDKSRNMPQ